MGAPLTSSVVMQLAIASNIWRGYNAVWLSSSAAAQKQKGLSRDAMWKGDFDFNRMVSGWLLCRYRPMPPVARLTKAAACMCTRCSNELTVVFHRLGEAKAM